MHYIWNTQKQRQTSKKKEKVENGLNIHQEEKD